MAKNDVRYEAIYARQSVDKKDSVSIETQIDDCKRLCSGIPRIYKDKGYSGKNTERPELQRLLNDIKAGIIQKVIVYKLDRISRNIVDFYKLYEVMKINGCMFKSCNEPFDTADPIMGETIMGVLAVFAQMERNNIRVRIKDNYEYRIKDGRWASGKAPFGFKNGKENGKATLIPIPEEIEIVKWMFKTYAESPNISLGMIQSRLIEMGITGHQSGKGFSRTTIGHILTNPVYCEADQTLCQYYQKKLIEFANPAEQWNGEYSAAIVGKNNRSLRNENKEGIIVYITNVKGVVSSRTFLIVQDRMEQNSAIASDNSPNNNLKELSGMLKCAECGSAIKMQTYPSLTCTGRSQKKICSVSFKGTRMETIQSNVAVKVQDYLEHMNETVSQKQRKRARTRKEIEELEKQLKNLTEMAKFSDNIAERLKFDMDDLIVRIKSKQLELKQEMPEDIISLRLGEEYIRGIYDGKGVLKIRYEDLDTEKRHMILKALVKKILVHADGNVDIEWKD
ncbi:MAG: recombinase family protein [Muribaculum sp.]|nr:recombinase family protein [Muribaculum sp.]